MLLLFLLMLPSLLGVYNEVLYTQNIMQYTCRLLLNGKELHQKGTTVSKWSGETAHARTLLVQQPAIASTAPPLDQCSETCCKAAQHSTICNRCRLAL